MDKIFREATLKDIPQIMEVRFLVRENRLSDPSLVTVEDCIDYIENRGNGWVCEDEGEIVGFSIVDLIDCNIWALFVHPDFDQQGIGKKLHNIMLEWYFQKTKKTLWLGTDQGTRAETFYRKAGWVEIGTHGKNEIKFEMTQEKWSFLKK